MIDDISPGTTEPTDRQTTSDSFHHNPGEQSISVSVIRAVAAVSEVDPLSLEPRLYDVIDPDALEALVSSDTADGDVRISFPFGRYLVTVTGTGGITVREESSH